MQTSSKSINAHQAFYLLLIMSVMFKVISLPACLIEMAGRDAWIVVLMYLIIDIIGLFAIYWFIKLSPDKTAFEVLEKTLGRTLATIIYLFAGLFALARILPLILKTEAYIQNNIYSYMDWKFFSLPILITCAYCAYKGLRSISRIIELLGIGILATMIIAIFSISFSTDFTNNLPVLEHGFGPVFKTFEKYIFFTGDYLSFLLFAGQIKFTKSLKRSFILAALLSFLIIIIYNLAFYGFYGDIAVIQKHGHALADMSQYMLGNESIARLDFVLTIIWCVIALLKIIVHFWVIFETIMRPFNIKDTPKNKTIVATILMLIVLAFKILFPNDIIVMYSIYTSVIKYILFIPNAVIMPILLPILSLIARKKDKDTEIKELFNPEGV